MNQFPLIRFTWLFRKKVIAREVLNSIVRVSRASKMFSSRKERSSYNTPASGELFSPKIIWRSEFWNYVTSLKFSLVWEELNFSQAYGAFDLLIEKCTVNIPFSFNLWRKRSFWLSWERFNALLRNRCRNRLRKKHLTQQLNPTFSAKGNRNETQKNYKGFIRITLNGLLILISSKWKRFEIILYSIECTQFLEPENSCIRKVLLSIFEQFFLGKACMVVRTFANYYSESFYYFISSISFEHWCMQSFFPNFMKLTFVKLTFHWESRNFKPFFSFRFH